MAGNTAGGCEIPVGRDGGFYQLRTILVMHGKGDGKHDSIGHFQFVGL